MTLIFELVLDSYERVPAIWNEVYDPYKFHKKIHSNKRIIHSYFQANRKEMDNQLATYIIQYCFTSNSSICFLLSYYGIIAIPFLWISLWIDTPSLCIDSTNILTFLPIRFRFFLLDLILVMVGPEQYKPGSPTWNPNELFCCCWCGTESSFAFNYNSPNIQRVTANEYTGEGFKCMFETMKSSLPIEAKQFTNEEREKGDKCIDNKK